MNDSDFNSAVERVFLQIEDELDNYDWDFDYDNTGDVFIIYHDTREYLVLTKHFARFEVWLAAEKEGHHFIYHNQHWVSNKNKDETILEIIKRYVDIACEAKS